MPSFNTPYKSLTSSIKDELYEPPPPPPDLPEETVARIRRLQQQAYQYTGPSGGDFNRGLEGVGGSPAELRTTRAASTIRDAYQRNIAPIQRGVGAATRISEAAQPAVSTGGQPLQYGTSDRIQRSQQAHDTAGDLLDIANKPIPYAREFIETAARGLAGAPLTAGPLGGAGGEETQVGVEGARGVGEVFVPQRVWEGVVELIPGVGSVDDVIRLARKGSPEVLAALSKFVDAETIQRFLKAGETGSFAPLDPLRAADEGVGGAGGSLPRGYVRPKPLKGKTPLIEPTDAELAHMLNLAESGDWTATPGARTGARSVVNMLLRGETPSDRQFALLHRVLASELPTAKPPRMPRVVGADELPVEPPRVLPTTPPEPDSLLKGDQGAQTPLDLGTVRLADGLRKSQLTDITNSPNVQERFGNFLRGVIGTPRFIANNKKDLAAAVIQVPRTLKTAIDIGWGGRNGWRLFPRHKAAWARMYGRQYTTLASEEAYTALQAQTMALPHAQRLRTRAKPLAFLERGTGDLETTAETSMSRFTQNLPILNRTERAYIAPGNAMRYEIANDVITQWEKRNGVPMPDNLLDELVDHYNAATLRGNTRYLAKAHAEVLGSILFSTKGLVSGPQYVAGGVKALLDPKLDAALKAEIAGDVAAYIAAGMGTMGLMAVANSQTDFASVDINTHSPTFGQVKVGPVRWNYWGADQSMVRQILTQFQGDRSIGGVTEDRSRLREGTNFIGNKLAPGIPRTAWDAAVNRGRTFEGRELDTPGGFAMNVADQLGPIPAETAKEANANAGPIAAIVSVLADLNGFTTSTYELSPRISKEQHEAKKVLEKSGYASVGTDIWKELQDEGSAPEGYASFGEFKSATIAELTTEIRAEEPDASIIDAQAAAERVFTRQFGDLEGAYTRVTKRMRERLRADPAIAEAIVVTGGDASARQEELAGVGQ